MKKIVIAAASVCLLGNAPVYSADLVDTTQVPYMNEGFAPFSWTGFYFGASSGYGIGGDSNVNSKGQLGANIANIATGARPGSVDLQRNGFMGAAQVGYNWQKGSIVYGLEADIAFTNIDDKRDFVTPQIATGLAQSNIVKSELEYLGTVRGRLGYASDRTLLYGTAGLAYGGTRASFDMFAPSGVRQFTDSASDAKFGYAVGAGVEYAVTDHFTLKTEYLYYRLEKEKLNVSAIAGTGVAGGYDSSFRNDAHLLRVGLNYKF